MYHRFIDHSFWVTQITLIRKLVDTYPLVNKHRDKGVTSKDKSVWSLLSLISDMEMNHETYFNRKVMLDAEGIEYDIDIVARRERQLDSKQIAGNTESYAIPRNCDPEVPFWRHAQLDE